MIICPRCGYPAPDGSPWCPRCGYGCPYPMQPPQLQQPPQMPAVYQPPPQIPPQYDIYDLPPQPQSDPVVPKKNKKKKKNRKRGCLTAILASITIIILGFIAIVLWAIADTSKYSVPPTAEPTLSLEELEATVEQQISQRSTIAALSATPTATMTFTPTPTRTPKPTRTPWPTDTPRPTSTPAPAVAAPSYTEPQTYSQSGTGYLGAVAGSSTNNTCVVKGSNSGIYHCSNSPNYNTMKNYVCFSSEAEAIAAGFKMSGNMHGWCAQ